MTLLELRDRCNELLAGACLPSYETGIENLRPSPGTMTLDYDNPLIEKVADLEAENYELSARVDDLEEEVQRLEGGR
jgi:hypothetical protein